ncbi:hypothetical protein OpiT1DRAFT_05650 [Opitutaceae bacterium TAV1]|nr:hypothetical protein OpiT1DRAFT_05650 [Opitutaceae bacterium TAV1]
MACGVARIGLGHTMAFRLGRKPGTPTMDEPTAVVATIAGCIPDDLIDGLMDYLKGMAQDIGTQSGITTKTVRDDFTKNPPSSSSSDGD